MQVSEENEIAISTHFIVLGLNLLFIMLAVHYYKTGTVLIKNMASVGGVPAEMTVFLLFLCLVAIDFIYVKGILKRKNENT